MSSTSDYQIRAILRSESIPSGNTGALSGTFNTWQDLSADRIWSITLNPTNDYSEYTRNIDFEIRNKNTLEIVSTTIGDFVISADTSAIGPQYSVTDPKYYWREYISDEIYWDGVQVFIGGQLSGTTYLASDGFRYTRSTLVTSNSSGTYYKLTREQVSGSINNITGDTASLYVNNGGLQASASGYSRITFNTNGVIYGAYVATSGNSTSPSNSFQKPWFTDTVDPNNYEIRAVKVSGDNVSNLNTWLSMGLNRSWTHSVSHSSNIGSDTKDTVLYFQIRDKNTLSILETTTNFTLYAKATYFYESNGGDTMIQ